MELLSPKDINTTSSCSTCKPRPPTLLTASGEDLFSLNEDSVTFDAKRVSLNSAEYWLFPVAYIRSARLRLELRKLRKDLREKQKERGCELLCSSLRKEIVRLQKIIRRMYFRAADFRDSCLTCLRNQYEEWLHQQLYLVFYSDKERRYVFKRAAKRGNSVYRKIIKRRIEQQTKFLDSKKFRCIVEQDRKKKTKTLFVTLTWNPEIFLGSRKDAWMHLEFYYNRFISAFRKRYGKCWVLKGVQSTQLGYPHIHLLIIMKNYEFGVFQHISADGKKTFRVDKNVKHGGIDTLWQSFIDVEVPVNAKAVKAYIVKDLIKSYNRMGEQRTAQDWLTLALCWVLRMKSYSISGFDGADLIEVGITQTQVDEILELNPEKRLIFLGLTILGCALGHPPPESFEIELSEAKRNELEHNWVRKNNAQSKPEVQYGYGVL